MWAKNLLFISLSLAGLALIASYLLDRNRIDTPRTFHGGAATLVSTAAAPPQSMTQKKDPTLPLWRNRTPGDWPQVAAKINSEFEQHWAAKGLSHAPRADELHIARRLSLALTGTIPSVEELRALEQVK